MVRPIRLPLAAATAAALLLVGCATRRVETPAPVAMAPPPAPPSRPQIPAGLPANLAVPATDADGRYLTINHGLDADETAWHLRSALNVAALGCRGPEEAGIIAAYNTMLTTRKTALAGVLRRVEARYKAEQGRDWRTEHDRHQTRLYNFFAQPAAQQRFCSVAAAVAAEVNGAGAADLVAYAATALPRLEEPFTDVYRAYDGYRRDLAAWEARYGSGTALAAVSPPPAAEAPATAPRLAYADMGELIRWDARDTRIRTAAR